MQLAFQKCRFLQKNHRNHRSTKVFYNKIFKTFLNVVSMDSYTETKVKEILDKKRIGRQRRKRERERERERKKKRKSARERKKERAKRKKD